VRRRKPTSEAWVTADSGPALREERYRLGEGSSELIWLTHA
jgi:hypothetical protein